MPIHLKDLSIGFSSESNKHNPEGENTIFAFFPHAHNLIIVYPPHTNSDPIQPHIPHSPLPQKAPQLIKTYRPNTFGLRPSSPNPRTHTNIPYPFSQPPPPKKLPHPPTSQNPTTTKHPAQPSKSHPSHHPSSPFPPSSSFSPLPPSPPPLIPPPFLPIQNTLQNPHSLNFSHPHDIPFRLTSTPIPNDSERHTSWFGGGR